MLSSKKIIEDYLYEKDWRVRENSNATYSYGAFGKYVLSEVQKDYWLREVYTPTIVDAYRQGFMHIHDLGELTVYCCGYSLKSVINMGVQGVPNIPKSAPAKHFDAILNQLANLITVFQNEIAGAVAFSSFDTLLAPFVKVDNLSYKQVLQDMQNFIFSINSNSRKGAEPAFSNLTFDLTPPKDLLNSKVIIGGKTLDFTYKECQKEMDMINRAFCELMLKGDSEGKLFSYPIPTYNIHERFDWDNPNNDLLWEMTGKFGVPYFANFINSDMKPEDARSMCCRLRLDKRELLKRNGGLFGSGDSTGSIGVVTLNLPRMGYLSESKEELFELIDLYMDIAKDSLEIKRRFLTENILNKNLIPAFNTYVGTFNNHFSTIGYVGMNECCVNFLGKDILSDEGKELAIEILNHMRNRLSDYQVSTNNLYNLEASPSESTAYRLALKDKKEFRNIVTQGTDNAPYYTNSCHIPVNKVESIKHMLDNQNDLQKLHTGGTVNHFFLDGGIPAEQAKHIVKTVCSNYEVPYISLSPISCYCPNHGYLEQTSQKCPKCGMTTDMIQRITGYPRKVKFYNDGKQAEFADRHQLGSGEYGL
ncbi:ribonucleoside triphosphate reductase [Clostridium paraputrificum]|uniref:ribonucleoside triphosphate reductase n=1 Tax=Clostridium paraputrificum TaxID=29363 RepID=UPI0018A02196|nr:ribonucleoside triphosphate reductase [Clostridium paraputrificum]